MKRCVFNLFVSYNFQSTDLSPLWLNLLLGTSRKDGGISRHALPPLTAIRRSTTNLKIKSNENCQKIELCGSLTTKDLNKKYHPDGQEGWRQEARAERM